LEGLYLWSEQVKSAARRSTSKLVAGEPERWTRREGSFALPMLPVILATNPVIRGAAEFYGLTIVLTTILSSARCLNLSP
jgi:hypothetical protein